MIDITILEQYFPEINKAIPIGKYQFTISFSQDATTFNINLKIKQEDTKKNHLVQFRFGMGQDNPEPHASHKTDAPHFEIDIYERTKEVFTARLYFTFQEHNDTQLMDYAKGTIALIEKIIEKFIELHGLDKQVIKKIIYDEEITKELAKYEEELIKALYECYKHSDLIVRHERTSEPIIIKTSHNLKKYLQIEELTPLYNQLTKQLEKDKK